MFTLLETEDLEGVWGSSTCRPSSASGVAVDEEPTVAADGGFTGGGGITNSPLPGKK